MGKIAQPTLPPMHLRQRLGSLVPPMFGPLSQGSASALGLSLLCFALQVPQPALSQQSAPSASTHRASVATAAVAQRASAASVDSARVFDLNLLSAGGRVLHRVSEMRHGQTALELNTVQTRRGKATMPHVFEQQSEPFAVVPGEDVVVYRELSWRDATVREAGVTRPDTVDVVIDVIDAASRRRLVLLDSTGIVRDASGATSVYGLTPPLSFVSAALPSHIYAERAILRRRSIVRGAITPTVTAREYVSRTPSLALNDPSTLAQRRRYGAGTESRDVAFLEAACYGRKPMSVETAPNGMMRITFPYAAKGGVTMLALFDATGRRQSIPVIVEGAASGNGTVTYVADSATPQFAALYHDNLLVSAVALSPAAAANKQQRLAGGAE